MCCFDVVEMADTGGVVYIDLIVNGNNWVVAEKLLNEFSTTTN
jgi:hypothetical protein